MNIILLFIILPSIIKSCSDSFDCFDSCNQYKCNEKECLCDITPLEYNIKFTSKLSMDY